VNKLDQAQGLERQKLTLTLIELERAVTLKDAVALEARSFNQLIHKDKTDRIELLMTIATYIKITCAITWNVQQNITPEQCVNVASQIIEDQHLTFEDVVCMLKKAKRGEYGTIYNRIDTSVIMEWINAYEIEREEAFEAARKKERDEFRISGERTNNVPGLVNYEKHLKQLKLTR
jgi:hypothetical protein